MTAGKIPEVSVPTPSSIPRRNTHEELIAEALGELTGLDDLDLPRALDRLTAATQALGRALDTPTGVIQPAFPGINQ